MPPRSDNISQILIPEFRPDRGRDSQSMKSYLPKPNRIDSAGVPLLPSSYDVRFRHTLQHVGHFRDAVLLDSNVILLRDVFWDCTRA